MGELNVIGACGIAGKALGEKISALSDNKAFLVFKKIMDSNTIVSFSKAGVWFMEGCKNPQRFMVIELPKETEFPKNAAIYASTGIEIPEGTSFPLIRHSNHNIKIFRMALLILLHNYINLRMQKNHSGIINATMIATACDFDASFISFAYKMIFDTRGLIYQKFDDWGNVDPLQKFNPFIMSKMEFETTKTDFNEVVSRSNYGNAFGSICMSIIELAYNVIKPISDGISAK